MAFLSCHRCGAAVSDDAAACLACGASQNPAARASELARRQMQRTLDTWRTLALVGVFAGFALGGGFVRWLEMPDSQSAPTEATASATSLTRDQTNDLFLRTLNTTFEKTHAPLDLVSWVPHPSGGIVLEMMPPSAQHPAVTWQALTTEDRQHLMEFIGVAYTQSLVAAGQKVDLATDGHPVVYLVYRGNPSTLAARLGDGRVVVYPSPYDGARAPTPMPSGTAPTGAVPVGAAPAPAARP